MGVDIGCSSILLGWIDMLPSTEGLGEVITGLANEGKGVVETLLKLGAIVKLGVSMFVSLFPTVKFASSEVSLNKSLDISMLIVGVGVTITGDGDITLNK